MKLSVIVCTHNPRRNYLIRVLDALQTQTLARSEWELLLVDNLSDPPLDSDFDISWHPNARYLLEKHLGLTYARICGITAARGELLIFVDDDNVLAYDYLETALRIGEAWPILGAWGGQCLPEFEKLPPDWTKSFWSLLAIREFDHDIWSNLSEPLITAPCGAGMCLRKEVGEKYARGVLESPRRFNLDRKGNVLTGTGDWDMAFTAVEAGLGTGQFTTLKLTHLMPAFRFQEDYLLRLVEGSYYSGVMFHAMRGKPQPKPSWRSQLRQYLRRWFMDSRSRRFHDATQRGINRAFKEIANSNV